jgi:hypothetical protein
MKWGEGVGGGGLWATQWAGLLSRPRICKQGVEAVSRPSKWFVGGKQEACRHYPRSARKPKDTEWIALVLPFRGCCAGPRPACGCVPPEERVQTAWAWNGRGGEGKA